MERLLRITLTLCAVAFALWLAKYLQENPVDPEIDRLHAEVARLRAANDEVREANDDMRRLVRGLREDPRVLDRRAREALGLSRDGETILVFDEPAGSERTTATP
jgi:cell division protein FtsB